MFDTFILKDKSGSNKNDGRTMAVLYFQPKFGIPILIMQTLWSSK